jgi:hypothetical protein
MTEELELRVVEDFAERLFRQDEGKRLGSGIVRLVRVPANDARLSKIPGLQKEIDREHGRAFFHGWEIVRTYTKREFDNASLFHLEITSVFEPAGEECGTTYEEATACPRCGAGARQTSPLYLPETRIPKGKDISRTIAGEIVVARRIKELFARHGITGAKLPPIRFKPSSSAESKDWFQLILENSRAEIVPPTRVGIDPFDDDPKDACRCSLGDLIGLNLISEVSIKATSRGEEDVIYTHQFVGTRRGLLRPERIILVSPKVRKLIESEKVSGVKLEVAHLV